MLTTRKFILPALPFFLFLLSASLFTSTGRDDTSITIWAASAFANSGQILNYNGQRIEQSSSLLQVLLLAGLAKLNLIQITDLARIISILAGMASLLVTYALIRRLHPGRDKSSLAFGAMTLLATSAYFVYWSFSGMETTLSALAMLLTVLLCGNFVQAARLTAPYFLAVVVGILIFMTVRPEAPLVLGVGLAGLVAVQAIGTVFKLQIRRAFLRSILLFALFLLCAAVLVLFRLWYFHSIFPQPVYAKVSALAPAVLWAGINYLYVHLRIEPGVGLGFTLALFGILYLGWITLNNRSMPSMYLWLAMLLSAAQVGFIVLTGGDWMEAGRFLVPLIPFTVVFIVLGAAELIHSARARVFLFAVLVVLQLLTLGHYARFYSTGAPLWSEIYLPREYESGAYGWFERHNRVNVRDMPMLFYLHQIIPRVASTHPQPLVLLSGQMGMISYHLATDFPNQLIFVDRNELIDRTFTDCVYVHEHPDPTVPWGVSWQYLFQNVAVLTERCHVPLPDLIDDLASDEDIISLEDNGYTILYRQSGFVQSNSKLFQGREIDANEFIAVRNELAPRVGQLERAEFIFDDIH